MVKQGDLITPTGRLVLPPGKLGSEEWLEFRRLRADVPGKYCIGSSDVPSILDLDGVDTPAHVYRAKVKGVRVKPNEQMQWGHLLEQPIALEWCRRNKAVIEEIGLVSNIDEPWRQCTVDRRVKECPLGTGEECILEVKNMDAHVGRRFHAELPDRVFAQMIDQLDVTGYRHAHYACLVGGNQLKQGVVYIDREIKVRDYVRTAVRAFRTDHLLAGVEPPWDVTRKPDKMIALDEATHPSRVGTLDLNGIGEVMEYASASAAASDAEKERKRQAAVLRQLADGKEFVTFAGQPAFRLGESPKTKVNIERLAEKYPDVYADPEVVSETTSHTIYIDKAYKVKGDRS